MLGICTHVNKYLDLKYKYKYSGLKYEYKYIKYPSLKYKYKYFKNVLEYNSSMNSNTTRVQVPSTHLRWVAIMLMTHTHTRQLQLIYHNANDTHTYTRQLQLISDNVANKTETTENKVTVFATWLQTQTN